MPFSGRATFALVIQTLLENRGSSGSSGSRPCKWLICNVIRGTTELHAREPLRFHWFSRLRASGACKSFIVQGVADAGTTGTTGTTVFEQANKVFGEVFWPMHHCHPPSGSTGHGRDEASRDRAPSGPSLAA